MILIFRGDRRKDKISNPLQNEKENKIILSHCTGFLDEKMKIIVEKLEMSFVGSYSHFEISNLSNI